MITTKNKVSFKSSIDNYNKEIEDLKNNTIRKIDPSDYRFMILCEWAINRDYKKNKKFIEITLKEDTSKFFIRVIKDITYFDSYIIITWKPINPEC